MVAAGLESWALCLAISMWQFRFLLETRFLSLLPYCTDCSRLFSKYVVSFKSGCIFLKAFPPRGLYCVFLFFVVFYPDCCHHPSCPCSLLLVAQTPLHSPLRPDMICVCVKLSALRPTGGTVRNAQAAGSPPCKPIIFCCVVPERVLVIAPIVVKRGVLLHLVEDFLRKCSSCLHEYIQCLTRWQLAPLVDDQRSMKDRYPRNVRSPAFHRLDLPQKHIFFSDVQPRPRRGRVGASTNVLMGMRAGGRQWVILRHLVVSM